MAADFTLFEISGFLLGQLHQWIHCVTTKGVLAPHPEPMVDSVSTRVHSTTGQQLSGVILSCQLLSMERDGFCWREAVFEVVVKAGSSVGGAPQEAQTIGTVEHMIMFFSQPDHCRQRQCPLQEWVTLFGVFCDLLYLDVNKCRTVGRVQTNSLVEVAVLAPPLFVEHHPVGNENKSFEL